MDMFIPVPAGDLTPEQKREALLTVTFIKETCDARVKGGCVLMVANSAKRLIEMKQHHPLSQTSLFFLQE